MSVLPLLRRGLVSMVCVSFAATASDPDSFLEPTPPLLSVAPAQGGVELRWTPYPAVDGYRVLFAPDAEGPFETWTAAGDPAGTLVPTPAGSAVYRVEARTLDTNALLTATVLSRLAYGPTPDELKRVGRIGPEAYIAEQLAPETVTEDLPHDRLSPKSGWQYVTATGTGSSSTLYLYLTSAGEGYIDDIKLVAGGTPEVGNNLIRNGDFEAALNAGDWVMAANHAGSALSTEVRHGGNASLRLKATAGGTTRESAIVQTITPSLSSSRTYTLSYWWLPSTNQPAGLTLRLSGSGITSSPGTLRDKLEDGFAEINDLRAWHVLNAVHSRRQLLEVLLQFLDNHFVTQQSKSADYLDGQYPGNGEDAVATQLEFKELQRWRRALLDPRCTFYDLLRISAESPAMIIYLDTVNNRGSNGRVANENYARELLELFTFGVDNGYEQRDIEEMAKVWTGWSVRYVRPEQEGNPFAPLSNQLRPGAPAGTTAITNLIGTWSFVFKDYNHNTSTKRLFYEHDGTGAVAGPKTYPARFGPAFAGKPYALDVVGRGGTNGVSEGYLVLRHLADQPFTREYLSVKLCRLFVHDEFVHGVYDYGATDLSPEAALVKACMEAWDRTEPKGQIRVVLETIFGSDLFRRHGASRHKVRTPLEFAVGSVRSLMARNQDGSHTATTDGYGLRNVMRRAGSMDLFNRADPDGFPEGGPSWISAGTLAERLRFSQALVMPAGYSARSDIVGNSRADPAALVRLELPAAQWTDAGAVADYFLGILFPGEGRANLAAYRRVAVRFLDTADDGTTESPFAGLSTGGNPSPWELRLRGMVAVLMTLPLTQEQ